eukprot:TRINITY_DN668_c0_g1_i4.p1 TRINITY_DN668_c0_g1~~TRINITY_DN668_c0_g1_i4.p1  ORF type:complete len:607 (-),score=196.55 TRINITY_DN668_c0_g1_i4:94-1914(-)
MKIYAIFTVFTVFITFILAIKVESERNFDLLGKRIQREEITDAHSHSYARFLDKIAEKSGKNGENHFGVDGKSFLIAKQLEPLLKSRGYSIGRFLESKQNGEIYLLKFMLGRGDLEMKPFQLKVHVTSEEISLLSLSMLPDNKLKVSAPKPINNTGNGQIETLLNLFGKTDCELTWTGLCKKGTVRPDSWTDFSLNFQRKIYEKLPLNEVPFLATHNSFNNRADGYGEDNGDLLINKFLKILFGPDYTWIYAQQEYTMTDQLNIGIRALHLDPHWVFNATRLCHSGAQVVIVDEIAKLWAEYYNETLDWDSQNLFCSPWDRTWEDGLKEIEEWLSLPSNSREFLFIHDDDQQHWTWEKEEQVVGPIKRIFGPRLFTPNDLENTFHGEWPTIEQLIELGFQLMFQSETYYGAYQGDVVFTPLLTPGWTANCIRHFTQYPDCGGYEPGDWSNFGGESQVAAPFFDGTSMCGILVPQNIPDFVKCSPSYLGFDQVSPALITNAVWTWEEGEPIIKSDEERCASLNFKSARWTTRPCSDKLFFLLGNPEDRTDFFISKRSGAFDSFNETSTVEFGIPRSGYQQQLVLAEMAKAKVSSVWVNFKFEKKGTR